jgi:Na+/H+-dicarboxylate symporter/ABC-type amino acid transport substrate-binding protein
VLSFSRQILVGVAAGIALGLFLGETASFLSFAADGFVQLLQMTVLPYVTVSLVRGLGSLGAREAKLLGWRTGRILLVFWGVALGLAFLFPLAFPVVETASFFSTTLLQPRAHFDFLSLYIPANPFHSLANNIVPAVVLFSAALGVALIGVEDKAHLLDVLGTLDKALARINHFIVRLTPYGLFAIAAVQAGTLSLDELKRLEIYLVTYALCALLVSLWALPGLVAALTPVGHRELLGETRDALIMAFTTGSLFAVLPLLTERSQALLRRHAPPGSGTDRLPEVIVPASFNFPHTGKIMSLSFILFAGWFSDAQVRIAEYPKLALTALVTFFGSLNVAVPFLLDMLRIPADMFQLFLATGLISSRFGTLVAAVHTVALAVLGSCAMSGTLRVEPRRVGRWAIITVALALVTFGGVRLLFGRVFPITYDKDKLLTEMATFEPRRPVASTPPAALPEPAGGELLDRIHARGRVRVGYLEDALPFAFTNARGELVGFDVEMAHELAGVLGVGLELVTLSRDRLVEHVERGDCDLVMSGVAVTPDRARSLVFSESYLDETLALLVFDHRRHEFQSWDALRRGGPLRIAVPSRVAYYEEKIHERLPQAVFFNRGGSVADLLGPQADAFDAALVTAERGSAWTLLYPRFSVVVPEGETVKVPLAYPVARKEAAFAAFLDTFIDLKRKDGTIDALYAHWILGRSATARRPRWSILRDVLHWKE